MNFKSKIELKITDHRKEIDGCVTMLQFLETDFNAAVASKTLDAPVYAQKYMILKDKILYHKACVAALSDVLSEIE